MTQIEKIKGEIERLKNELIQEAEKGYKSEFDEGRISAFEDMTVYIDSLEEEPVSNDLEEACDEYYDETWDEHGGKAMVVDGCHDIWFPSQATDDFFKAGAQWQKEQMMKNSTFINEVEWEDDIHKLFKEKGKKVKLMIVKEE